MLNEIVCHVCFRHYPIKANRSRQSLKCKQCGTVLTIQDGRSAAIVPRLPFTVWAFFGTREPVPDLPEVRYLPHVTAAKGIPAKRRHATRRGSPPLLTNRRLRGSRTLIPRNRRSSRTRSPARRAHMQCRRENPLPSPGRTMLDTEDRCDEVRDGSHIRLHPARPTPVAAAGRGTLAQRLYHIALETILGFRRDQ